MAEPLMKVIDKWLRQVAGQTGYVGKSEAV